MMKDHTFRCQLRYTRRALLGIGVVNLQIAVTQIVAQHQNNIRHIFLRDLLSGSAAPEAERCQHGGDKQRISPQTAPIRAVAKPACLKTLIHIPNLFHDLLAFFKS